MSDAEILTTALMPARYFYGNLGSAMFYMKEYQGIAMIDNFDFIRRPHGLRQAMQALFYALTQPLKELNTNARYLIDSFPVAVWDNIRIPSWRFVIGK